MNVRIRDARPSDQEFLAHGNEAMALETEHKRLDPQTIRSGVHACSRIPHTVATSWPKTTHGKASASSWSRTSGATGATASSGGSRACTSTPPHADGGVFHALYDHVDTLCRSTPGVIGLRLYVELENSAAQRIYERCGMRDGGYRLMEVDNSGAIQDAAIGE